jgi:uncharacterized protein YajQ (UPF0234 family)
MPSEHAENSILLPVASFDIGCDVDLQEVRNAVDQANREASVRFDFRGTDSRISWKGKDTLLLESSSEPRLQALEELLKEKLARRRVSQKALSPGPVREAAGGRFRREVTVTTSLSPDVLKQIQKIIRGLSLKKLTVQPLTDGLRVQSPSRDDLQLVIKTLKESDLGVPLSFGNFRS